MRRPMMHESRRRLGLVRQHEVRILALEKDMARLEQVVANVVEGMKEEHRAMREAIKEDRASLKELAKTMEASVATMAAKIATLAEHTSSVDSALLQKNSFAKGAVNSAGWIFGALIGLGTLFGAYRDGARQEHGAPPSPAGEARRAP